MGDSMIKSLYGFRADLAPFRGLLPAAQVALLQSWGCDVVFGGYRDAQFVEAAHAAGLKVYAEFGCFVGQQWWRDVPTSRPVTADGKLLETADWYFGVNPSDPTGRSRQLTALEQLLRDYELDGVWLDFIRWPCHWEAPDPVRPVTSFDRPTVARFARDRDISISEGSPAEAASLILREHRSAWDDWRCQQITDWVAQAKAVLQQIRPGALLGLFGVPWRLADFDGAIVSTIGQDFRALGQHVDVFSPMVYHRMCGQPVQWIAEVTTEVHRMSGKAVWPIIQSVDKPTPLTAEEYGAALEVAMGCDAAQGVLVFTLEGALAPAKLQVTQDKFLVIE